MTDKELFTRIYKEAKVLKIISYIQFVSITPLLLIHLLYIIVVILSFGLVYNCKQFHVKFDEYNNYMDGEQLYLAEDSLEEAGKRVYYASIISLILFFVILPLSFIIPKINILFCYLILVAILYMPYFPLCEYIQKAIKGLIISLQLYRDTKESRKGCSYSL